MTDTVTERRAAEHAGLWKADRGQAPHYTRHTAPGWTCLACPLDGCEWHHDDPVSHPAAAEILEAKVREHLETHSVLDFVHSLQAARDSVVAVRESNNRAWDVVNLHRLRALHRGEAARTDPFAQMLSAALVGTSEHDDVRVELTRLSEGVVGAQNIASVPVEDRLGSMGSSRP